MSLLTIDGTRLAQRIIELKCTYHAKQDAYDLKFGTELNDEQSNSLAELQDILTEAKNLYTVHKCDPSTIMDILQQMTEDERVIFYQQISPYTI